MRRVAVLVSCGALVLPLACADDPGTDGGLDAAVAPADTAVAGASDGTDGTMPQGAGDTVLDVTAPVVGGGTISLAEYRGAPLALWFWAPT